jgi:hypothetical protein
MITRRTLPLLGALALSACDSGAAGTDLRDFLHPDGANAKSDQVGMDEVAIYDHQLIVFGDAGGDLFRAATAAGLTSFEADGLDYRAGTFLVCASDGGAAACAIEATAEAGDDLYALTLHGPRFASAPSELFGILAAANGVAPSQASFLESHRFACGKDADDVWCGLRTASRRTIRIENVAAFDNLKSGAFAVPVGAADAGPLAPGQAFEWSFTAGPKHRLSFATMFGQSNDWFFAPEAAGVALYEDGTPIAGDITDRVFLWDAGTEVDEEPAIGPHTGPRQMASTDGPGAADPDTDVRRVAGDVTLTSGDVFAVPAVSEMIRVTVASDAATRRFTVRIENVADDAMTLMTSQGAKPVRVSPGVFAVSDGDDVLFSEGAPDRGRGLEAIAESGDVSALAAATAATGGVATPVSPGVYVLHRGGAPLFVEGLPDRGLGLRDIAETGDTSVLGQSLADALPRDASGFGSFAVPVGAADAGPIRPGAAYRFEVIAVPGDRLSFATMYGASNDWIFATDERGFELFDDGVPRTGEVTGEIGLFDVGTEMSEEPAVGANIGGPRGPADADARVRRVDATAYATPVADHIRVTVE